MSNKTEIHDAIDGTTYMINLEGEFIYITSSNSTKVLCIDNVKCDVDFSDIGKVISYIDQYNKVFCK